MKLTLTLKGSPARVMALVSSLTTQDTSSVKITMSMEPQAIEYDPELNPKDILDMPIEDLDLSVRAYNNLKIAEIHTVRELVNWTRSDIAELRTVKETGMNEKATAEVIDKLARYGLSLKPEPRTPIAKIK